MKQLGADVYVTREAAEPVCGLRLSDVNPVVPAVLTQRPYILPAAFHSRTKNVRKSDPAYRSIAAEILLTKNLETLARAEKARRAFTPDLTIVLQFDATPSSCHAGLTDINRNIFFVEGAYTPKELANDPRQRLKLLTKLLQNVTPTETRVAVNIARRFKEATGFPPVPDGLRQFEMKTGSVRAAPRHPDIQQGIHRADVRPDGPVGPAHVSRLVASERKSPRPSRREWRGSQCSDQSGRSTRRTTPVRRRGHAAPASSSRYPDVDRARRKIDGPCSKRWWNRCPCGLCL